MWNFDFRGLFIFLMIVSAFSGWAAIEFILWLLSHITIGWA
jgi:hypothetical protein